MRPPPPGPGGAMFGKDLYYISLLGAPSEKTPWMLQFGGHHLALNVTIAAFFGLFHGLAFASTLNELGLARWERVAGILAFNLGIETMQIAVVAAVLPSLLLMSRTRAYPLVRTVGAFSAGAASLMWIAERIWGVRSPVDLVVNGLMHHAMWIAAGLLLMSIACWALQYWMGARAASSQEGRGEYMEGIPAAAK
jgi:hypothetical protein